MGENTNRATLNYTTREFYHEKLEVWSTVCGLAPPAVRAAWDWRLSSFTQCWGNTRGDWEVSKPASDSLYPVSVSTQKLVQKKAAPKSQLK